MAILKSVPTSKDWTRRLIQAARRLESDGHIYGCAYCGGKFFKSIRIDKVEDSDYICLVNWCPECKKEDWIMLDAEALAPAAVLASIC
jgi:predicted SprT family Zn-dependent metalloprotease